MAALDDIHAVGIVYVAETSPPSSFHLVENQVVDKGDTIGDRLSRSLNEVKVRGVKQISRKLLIFIKNMMSSHPLSIVSQWILKCECASRCFQQG